MLNPNGEPVTGIAQRPGTSIASEQRTMLDGIVEASVHSHGGDVHATLQ